MYVHYCCFTPDTVPDHPDLPPDLLPDHNHPDLAPDRPLDLPPPDPECLQGWHNQLLRLVIWYTSSIRTPLNLRHLLKLDKFPMPLAVPVHIEQGT